MIPGIDLNMCRKPEILADAAWWILTTESKSATGQFYIEPKPREPSTHQYDSDSAACLNFLREHGLMGELKLNIDAIGSV